LEVTLKTIAAFALAVAAASAQSWEIGAAAGSGAYHDGTVTAAAGQAQAGMGNGITPSVVVCDNMYEHVSGEFRYLYQGGQPFVSQGSVKGTMAGKSHTFVYDALIHVRRRDSRFRPYFAIGAGVKGYLAPGPAPSPEPLLKIAALVAKNQWTLVGSVGGGIKVKVQKHIVLRFDIRDYPTQFPKRQIVPASGASASSLLQQITPMAGVSLVF
jgi:hypothetical protein